jgi:prevent-host-death family protein
VSETVGIRELRHNTADIITAAEAGQSFRVTVRGKDTGVIIAKQPPAQPIERRHGITLAQIKQAGLHARPTSDRFQETMLDLIERGRNAAGRVGNHDR